MVAAPVSVTRLEEREAHRVPAAQLIAARAMSRAQPVPCGAVGAVGSAGSVVVPVAIRTRATPAKPSARRSRAGLPGRSPRTRRRTATQSGIAATSRAAVLA